MNLAIGIAWALIVFGWIVIWVFSLKEKKRTRKLYEEALPSVTRLMDRLSDNTTAMAERAYNKCPYCGKYESATDRHERCISKAENKAKAHLLKTVKDLSK